MVVRVRIHENFVNKMSARQFLNKYKNSLKETKFTMNRPVSVRGINTNSYAMKVLKEHRNRMRAEYNFRLEKKERTTNNFNKLVKLKAFLSLTNLSGFKNLNQSAKNAFIARIPLVAKQWKMGDIASIRELIQNLPRAPSSAKSARGPP